MGRSAIGVQGPRTPKFSRPPGSAMGPRAPYAGAVAASRVGSAAQLALGPLHHAHDGRVRRVACGDSAAGQAKTTSDQRSSGRQLLLGQLEQLARKLRLRAAAHPSVFDAQDHGLAQRPAGMIIGGQPATRQGISGHVLGSVRADQRRRTGIEPADDAERRPPVLKTGGTTRHPDASETRPYRRVRRPGGRPDQALA